MTTPNETEFRRATLALAADAATQITLFPPFVCFGDELLLDWDDALRMLRGSHDAPFSDEAERAIAELERQISACSGKQNERMFCSPAALSADPRWDTIRALAVAVCVASGWRIEPPWPSGATYVPGR